MILRDVDNIKVGSTSVNKVYQGNYKVYDKNKIALEGYCKQNTTTGKNLFKIPFTIVTGAGTGITPTYNDDGSITLNGTSTGGVVEFRSVVQLSETHTLSYTSNKTSSNLYIRTRTYSSDETSFPSIQDSITLDQTSNSITSSKTFGFVCITIANNTTLDNFTIYPQLETNSIATDFEPYTGGIASPNPNYPQEIEVMEGRQVVNVSSENMLDKQYFENGSIDATTGQNIDNFQNGRGNNYIPVLPNTTYTISTKNNVFQLRLSEYTNSKTNIQRDGITNNNKLTITTTSNTYYLRWSLNYDGSTTVTQQIIDSLDLQLQEGSTATPYVPYKSQDFEVDLKSKNELDVNKKPYFLSNSELNGAIVTVDEKDNGILNVDTTSASNSVVIRSEWTNVDSKNILLKAGTYFSTVRLNIKLKESNVSKQTDIGMFTVEEDFYITQWFLPVAKGIVTTVYLQLQKIEENSTATDYEPYYNYKLAGIGDYKDNIYTKEGKWYVKSLIGKVVLDGSETIASYRTNVLDHYRYAFGVSNVKRAETTWSIPIILSSHYKPQVLDSNGSYGAHQGIAINNNADEIIINDDTYYTQDSSAYKTWLSNNNVTAYYALATPTEEEITSPTLIQQLNRLYQAM